ncbi:MAG: alkaline phosphatase, partial [Burkholderiales bacterium]
MSTTRRQFLHSSTAAALGSSPGWWQPAHGEETAAEPAASAPAPAPRFGLGIASGSPTARGVVLWTRLTGGDLPPRV